MRESEEKLGVQQPQPGRARGDWCSGVFFKIYSGYISCFEISPPAFKTGSSHTHTMRTRDLARRRRRGATHGFSATGHRTLRSTLEHAIRKTRAQGQGRQGAPRERTVVALTRPRPRGRTAHIPATTTTPSAGSTTS